VIGDTRCITEFSVRDSEGGACMVFRFMSKEKIMFRFKVVYADWNGAHVRGEMRIVGQPNREIAAVVAKALLAIEGYEVLFIE